MSLFWLWPLGLAGLASLLLPVLLHLDRRRTLQRIPFAAMRFIGAGHPPRRTLRLVERALLLLRLLLLAAVVVWLAEPLLRGLPVSPQRWLAVAPGVSAARIAQERRDGEQAIWLAASFPTIDQPQSQSRQPIASLLRELDAQLAPNDALRVLVPETINGLDAEALVLGRDVDWLIDRDAAPPDPAVTADPPSPLRWTIRQGDEHADQVGWLLAAAQAWQTGRVVDTDRAPIDAPVSDTATTIVWFGDTPSASIWAAVERGATLLQIGGTDPSEPTAWPPTMQRRGSGRWARIDAPLQPARYPILHSAQFPGELQAVLFGPAPPPTRALASDVAPTRSERASGEPLRPLRPWLAWLIAALFLAERGLATGRRLRGAR